MGNLCNTPEQNNKKFPENHPLISPQVQYHPSRKNTDQLLKIKNVDIQSQYTVIEPPIGFGSYGNVYKVIQLTTGIIRAAKKIQINPTLQQDIYERQFQLLKLLDHPNIIKVYDIFKSTNDYSIVTQLCNGGELFQRLASEGRLTQSISSHYFQQLLQAIHYCHSKSIIHRDLKPQNIVFSKKGQSGVLKIIDFGASCLMKPGQILEKRIGTSLFVAPEILSKSYDQKCDMWSAGVILYLMLSGKPPFNGKNNNQILANVLVGKYDLEGGIWKKISEEAKDLIKKLLELDPKARISAKQALQHVWIKQKKLKTQTMNESQKQQLIENIRTFRKLSQFQDSMAAFIVRFIVSSEQKNRMIEYFKQFDINKDGKITKQELEANMKKITKIQFNKQQIQDIFQSIDKDNSGYIDYSEFVTASLKRNILVNQVYIDNAFKVIDSDHNGKLSKQELMKYLGGSISEDLYYEIIKQCDQNRDGQITNEQFKNMMKKIIFNKL